MPNQPIDQSKSIPQVASPASAAGISRRRFGRNAATLATLSLAPSQLLADPESSVAVQNPEDLAKLKITPEQAREVEAKLSNIIRKYGDRLSPEQREHLRRILAYNERMLAGVRAFAVQNGDPPASVLRVSFADDKIVSERSASRTISKPQSVKPMPKR